MRKPVPLLSLLFVCLFLLPFPAEEDEWVLRKEKNGIKVFTRKTLESKIKELRMTFQTKATLSNIISLLNDTEAYEDWIYRFKESTILEQNDVQNSIYYGSLDFPWPLTDRDLVAKSVTLQDPHTKVVTITTTAIPGYVDEKDNMVRITNHYNTWRFEPLPNGVIDIEYELHSDPGGSIPNWAINMALDQGSTQSMEAFLDMLGKDPYRTTRLSYIVD